MDGYDEKVRAAQAIILVWYGVIVDLKGIDEEILDFVNDDISEEDVGSDNQTFAAWCDQVFGFDEFGIRVRPPVAQFSPEIPGQTRIFSIRDGADLSMTLREWDEGSRLAVKSSRLEVKRLKSKIRSLEKVYVGNNAKIEVLEVAKEKVVNQGLHSLINDLHVLDEEFSGGWAPGLKLDLVEVLNEIDNEESADSVVVLANLMSRINKRIIRVGQRKAREENDANSAEVGVAASVESGGVSTKVSGEGAHSSCDVGKYTASFDGKAIWEFSVEDSEFEFHKWLEGNGYRQGDSIINVSGQDYFMWSSQYYCNDGKIGVKASGDWHDLMVSGESDVICKLKEAYIEQVIRNNGQGR